MYEHRAKVMKKPEFEPTALCSAAPITASAAALVVDTGVVARLEWPLDCFR